MNDHRNSEKREKKLFAGFWGTILMVFLITVAFGILIYGMYVADIVSVFDLSSVFYNKNQDNAINKDNIYEELRSDNYISDFRFMYNITPQELTAIIAELRSPDSYSVRSETVYSGDTADRVITIEAETAPDRYSVKKFSNGELYESVILEDGIVTVTDNIRNRFSKYPDSDEFSFESVAGIPSVTLVTDVCESIIDQSNSDVTDYSISLVSRASETFYRVEFTYSDLSQKEEYYISSDSGMIINLYTFIDDNMIYRYNLSEYSQS